MNWKRGFQCFADNLPPAALQKAGVLIVAWLDNFTHLAGVIFELHDQSPFFVFGSGAGVLIVSKMGLCKNKKKHQ